MISNYWLNFQTCEEYQSMVKDKVEEAEWKCLDVNEHWQQMKNIMMDTAQVACGLSKGPCRHYETKSRETVVCVPAIILLNILFWPNAGCAFQSRIRLWLKVKFIDLVHL